MRETWVRFLVQEDPLEKRMATHSSILAWRIPWTEDPGRLLSTGSQRVRHDWVTSLSFTFLHNICILALCSGSIIAKQVYPRCDYCYYKWVKFISRMHFWAYLCMRVCSVASSSLQSYWLQPARLLYPCMGFSRQEYWSGLPCPPPGDLPDLGIESMTPGSSALQLDSLSSKPPAAAAAKSLQSCPTLCDPIDGSPPGSLIPGILQARTLEWGAIAWEVCFWAQWGSNREEVTQIFGGRRAVCGRNI